MIAFIIRLFLLIVLVLMVYPVLRRMFVGLQALQHRNPPIQYEPMVSCAACGLHLPLAGAIVRRGRHYCSQEHASQPQ